MIDYKKIDFNQFGKAPGLVVTKLLQIKRQNPDKVYYAHRIDDRYDPQGIELEKVLAKGYSVVMEEDSEVEDSILTQKGSNKDKIKKPVPLVTTGKGGEIFLHCWIDKAAWQKLRDEDAKFGMEKLTPQKVGRELFIKDPNVATEHTQIIDSLK